MAWTRRLDKHGRSRKIGSRSSIPAALCRKPGPNSTRWRWVDNTTRLSRSPCAHRSIGPTVPPMTKRSEPCGALGHKVADRAKEQASAGIRPQWLLAESCRPTHWLGNWECGSQCSGNSFFNPQKDSRCSCRGRRCDFREKLERLCTGHQLGRRWFSQSKKAKTAIPSLKSF